MKSPKLKINLEPKRQHPLKLEGWPVCVCRYPIVGTPKVVYMLHVIHGIPNSMDTMRIHGDHTSSWYHYSGGMGQIPPLQCTIPWIFVISMDIYKKSSSLLVLLLLLLPTIPTTVTTTATTYIVAVASQTIALTSYPSPCCITSLSLGLLVTIFVTKSQTTLSPRGH